MKLTLPQQDVYYEQLMYPDFPIYNIGAKISIQGNIDYEVLNKAYNALINQHDIYRSYVDSSADQVEVHIQDSFEQALEYIDFSSEENADAVANTFMQETFKTPFNLKEDQQLHKFILIKTGTSFHYLFSVYHHIITDGWGTSLMFQRLVKNYNELLQDGVITTEYPYSYLDFVTDDETYYTSEAFQKDKNYWKEKFSDLPEQLMELKAGQKALPQSSRKAISLKRTVYNQLEKIGKEEGCSTFHVILGILFLYFGRKHQNNDFAIGLPVLNRGKFIFKRTVGLFMGVAPLRIQIDQDESFTDLIKCIKKQLRTDYRYQRFPFGKLVKALNLFGAADQIFNISLSYEKQDYASHFLNTQTKVMPLSHQSERVALAIYIREFDQAEDVTIDFDYNLNYFDETSITAISTHFQNLITGLVENPKLPLHTYDYLSKTETQQLLEQFNETTYKNPTSCTLIDLIAQQSKLNPDKIILKDETKSYTYKQLEEESNRLANYLQAKGIGKMNSPIAVLMNRSADLIISLLGILKSGSTYIPLDPSFPALRLSYILEHSEAKQIIGSAAFENTITSNAEYIVIDSILDEKAESCKAINKSKPEAAAYIIYTSGSTGNPKGVEISHQALLNFLISMKHIPGIGDTDTLFSVTTQSFDISMLEFFAPLISSATLFIASPQLLSDPISTLEAIAEINPTIIQATPSFFKMLYNAGWAGNKNLKVLCGGDLLSNSLAAKLLDSNKVLWNMYGPTETTIWSTCKKIQHASDASTIGKPIHNTQIYILDQKMQLLPIGASGKIYIGGEGLAKGYYKNETLTDQRFIKNKFLPEQKIYDTGDLGKWNEDGELEFLGRDDFQVKIRGYRIELGEIETALHQLKEVKDAVVIVQKKEGSEAKLIAYIIPNAPIDDPSLLLNALQEQLPEYMIPYNIIALDEFPLTLNNKVDRKALVARKINATTTTIINPKTSLEISLHRFYQEILEITNEISTDSNFFALGGHSLNAVKLINLINDQLRYRLTLKDIFENPTIQKLGTLLGKKQISNLSPIVALAEKEFYDISPSQYHIWLASQQEEKSIAYNMAGLYKVHKPIEKDILEMVFREIVERHEVLRTGFVEKNGKVKQKIRSMHVCNTKIDSYDSDQNGIESLFKSFAALAFDLEKGCLLEIGLVFHNDTCSYLMFKTHHIIMDGWSIEILIREVLERYYAKIKGYNIVSEKLAFQFKDFTAWHLKGMEETNDKNKNFWEKQLHQYDWKNIIKYDHTNKLDSNRGESIRKAFTKVDSKKLELFLKQAQISLHTLLVGTFNLLINKIYGLNDICIGIANAGRTTSEQEKLLGMFVKTLPLRTLIRDDEISKILSDIHEGILTVNMYEDLPLSIINTLRIDALIVLQNTAGYNQIKLDEEVWLEHVPVGISYSRIPLLLNFKIEQSELKIQADYSLGHYDESTIELCLLKYEKLLLEIIGNPDQHLDKIDVELEIEQKETIDIEFNF